MVFQIKRVARYFDELGVSYSLQLDEVENDVVSCLLLIDQLKASYDRWRNEQVEKFASRLRELLVEVTGFTKDQKADR